jgi:hypothetical protein
MAPSMPGIIRQTLIVNSCKSHQQRKSLRRLAISILDPDVHQLRCPLLSNGKMGTLPSTISARNSRAVFVTFWGAMTRLVISLPRQIIPYPGLENALWLDQRIRWVLLRWNCAHYNKFLISQLIEHRYICVNYESRVTWREETDLLCCLPSFHSVPRYDFVMVGSGSSIQLTFSWLVFVFTYRF